MTTRDRIVARIPEMPSLPAAVSRVLQLAQGRDTGVGEIVEAIAYDPVLTAEMLRLANTAYFAGPRSIGSLREACVLFGVQRILQLVLASAIFPIARHPLMGYDMPAGQLIRHSMAAAIGAEELARLHGRPAPVHAFTAALLSDIGKIVLGDFLEIDAGPIVRLAASEEISFELAERRVLGIDHAEAGALLLEAWRLPENVIESVRWHHDPDRATLDTYAADLVHVAGHLSTTFGLGGGVDGLNYRPSPNAIARLNAGNVMLERAAAGMLAGLAQIQHQLPDAP